MNVTNQPLFIRLLERSPLAPSELSNLIDTAPARYKEHTIEKRHGRGQRLIAQPTAEVKFFQRLLVEELKYLPIHDAAKAYRNEKSILDHALPHANSRYLLKLDFRDFFPSIFGSAIARMLIATQNYTSDEIWMMCQLLCRRRHRTGRLHLSIGSPSSPFISNVVMFEFDSRLAEYCLAGDVVYTRYADDIALSTSRPKVLDTVFGYVRYLTENLRYLHLSLNDDKTVNVSKKFRRTLTGLTLSNSGTVSIGRSQKRILRSALHRISNGQPTTLSGDQLRGMFAYVYAIDPDWVTSLCERYSIKSISEIGD